MSENFSLILKIEQLLQLAVSGQDDGERAKYVVREMTTQLRTIKQHLLTRQNIATQTTNEEVKGLQEDYEQMNSELKNLINEFYNFEKEFIQPIQQKFEPKPPPVDINELLASLNQPKKRIVESIDEDEV